MEREVTEEEREEAPVMGTVQIGVSRPPLPVTDLPTAEEVFKIKGPIGPAKTLRYIVGPSLIALGVSIGSGEWLLGPLNVGKFGFLGIGWVILTSAVLQVFYNVELARFTVATGEAPALGFGRVPPGFWLWTPLAVALYYMAFIWGGWASAGGQSLFALLIGRAPNVRDPADLQTVRTMAIGLLFLVFFIVLFGRKISRTMELANWVMVVFVLISVAALALIVVPAPFWGSSFASLVTPAVPPAGTSATELGALAGFTATASGLNYFIINYYRDKGYGMGHRVGFIAGLVGGKQERVLASGTTFPDDEKNRGRWKQWYKYILIDQWGVFFVGAILGMMLPSILVGYLASDLPAAQRPDTATIPTFAAVQLTARYSAFLGTWALIVGFVILFSTQMVVFEALTRQFVDAAHGISGRFRKLIREDPRRFYYPFMLVLAIVISIAIFQALPTGLILISANMSNLASLIIPFVVMYMNSKLPAPARIKWWGYVILLLNVIFFGFFFVNFVADQFGDPLVKF